jgi:hypothetical protein
MRFQKPDKRSEFRAQAVLTHPLPIHRQNQCAAAVSVKGLDVQRPGYNPCERIDTRCCRPPQMEDG